MDLSIVILNYKAAGLLRQCLKSIKLLNLNLQYEVIVIDNDSGDGCEEMMRQHFPEFYFIQSGKNLGYSTGVNQGLRKAKGRYIFILNPDILMLSNAIDPMVKYLESHPDVGLLAPRLVNPDGTIQYSVYKFPTFMMPFYRRTFMGKLPWFRQRVDEYLLKNWDHKDTREVDWMLGGCMMTRRDAMDRVGLMDERFFMFFEDVDFCRRFWEAGYKVVYLADAELVHYHQRPSAGSWLLFGLFKKPTREHIKSWLKYFAKYAGAKNPRQKKYDQD